MAKLAKCPSVLLIPSIEASVECRYVGTETAVRNHGSIGKHQTVIDRTGGTFPFQIVWWTNLNGG